MNVGAALENSGAVAASAVPVLLDYLATPEPAVSAGENPFDVSEWSVRIAVVKTVARWPGRQRGTVTGAAAGPHEAKKEASSR